MSVIPTDAELLREIRSISKTAPHLMVCANCANYSIATGECSANNLRFPPYIRGCEGRLFVTDEQLLLAKVKKELSEQASDLEKIENLLALVISTSTAASCFAEDLNKRLLNMRKLERKDIKSDIKKDLDVVDDIKGALSRIDKITEKMQKDLQGSLDKIDAQYRNYIERHINKLFTINGVFDVKRSDGNLNNAMVISALIGKFVKGCLHNDENYNRVFALLDSLENENAPYALTHKDFEHYKLKGFQ